jgi:hypothetical protein
MYVLTNQFDYNGLFDLYNFSQNGQWSLNKLNNESKWPKNFSQNDQWSLLKLNT